MSTLNVNTINASTSGQAVAVDIKNPKSFRNLIINGAMEVAQRGTSSTEHGMHTIDRWSHFRSGVNEAPTFSQADVASGTTPYELGFRKCLKTVNGHQTGGAGANDYVSLDYRWEAQDIASSGWDYTSTSSYVTLSFWVKSSVAQNFYFHLTTKDGTTQNYPMETGTLSENTWTKITKTIPGNSNLQFDNNSDAGLQIRIILFRGTSTTGTITLNQWGAYNTNLRIPDNATTWYTTNDATFELTGAQLEVGSYATDFEHRSYGEELLKCQRYCMRWDNDDSSHGNHARMPVGMITGGSTGSFPLHHTVPMRATDGRAISYSIATLSPQAGGGGNKTPPSLSIMSDGSTSNTTWVNMALDSGRSNNTLFHVRVGSDNDWQIVVSNEL